MKIFLRDENFLVRCVEVQIGEATLDFVGEEAVFSIPYSAVKDFCIMQNGRGKTYFTALYDGKMCEGQIVDAKEVEPFTSKLKEKMGGVIHINVQKN